MGVAAIRRLKQLEEQNAKLKRLMVDLTLDKAMLRDALRKYVLKPARPARSSAIVRMSSQCPSAVLAGRWAPGGLPTDSSPAAIRL